MRRSTSRCILAIALVAMLGVMPLAETPAAAEVASPRTIDYPLGALQNRSVALNYGEPRGDSIPIGTNTTRVVFQTTDSPTDGTLSGRVSCRLYGNHSPSVEDADDSTPLGGDIVKQWSAAEWADPSARFLDVPAGVVVQWPGGDPDDYDRFDLYCNSEPAPVTRQVSRLLWRLTPVPSGDAVVTLTQDPAQLWSSVGQDRYLDPSPVEQVAPGDLVRLTSPVGTWSSEADVAISGVASPSPSVSPDGTVVTFRMPALAASDAGRSAGITIRGATRSVSGGLTVVNNVEWRTTVLLNNPDVRASATTLSLDRKYGLSFRRVTATVTVTTPGSVSTPPPARSVAILVDGRQVTTATLSPSGTVRVPLPLLPRGPHRITAHYLGDDRTGPSTSSSVRLRILV